MSPHQNEGIFNDIEKNCHQSTTSASLSVSLRVLNVQNVLLFDWWHHWMVYQNRLVVLMEQVFRQTGAYVGKITSVLIPDSWGKSSDVKWYFKPSSWWVLIPDSWGKSSDHWRRLPRTLSIRLNPRFVGQVFRLYARAFPLLVLQVLIPDSWGKSSDD